MAITVGNITSAEDEATTTSFTWSHDSNSDFLLLTFLAITTGSNTVSSVQYNSLGMTLIGVEEDQSALKNGQARYYVSPATGAHNAVVATDEADDQVGGTISFSGVDTSDPIHANTSKKGTSADPFHAITTTVDNCMLVAILCWENGTTALSISSAGWDVHVNRGPSEGQMLVATKIKTTAGSETINFETGTTSDDYVIILVALKPAAGGPVEAVGTANGVATVTGAGQSTNESAGTCAAVTTASADAEATVESVGSIALVSSLTAEGQSTVQAAGTIAGVASVLSVGARIIPSAGDVQNIGTVTGDSQAIFESTGVASGTATVSAVGENAGGGVSEATGTGGGIASITGVGQSNFLSDGVSNVQSTVTGIGQAIVPSVGTITNQAAVSAIAQFIFESAASAGGVAAVTALGRALSQSSGVSQGQAVLNAVTQSLAQSDGLILNILTTTATGQDAGAPADIEEGVGIITIQNVTSGVGARITIGLMGSSIDDLEINMPLMANEDIKSSAFSSEGLM